VLRHCRHRLFPNIHSYSRVSFSSVSFFVAEHVITEVSWMSSSRIRILGRRRLVVEGSDLSSWQLQFEYIFRCRQFLYSTCTGFLHVYTSSFIFRTSSSRTRISPSLSFIQDSNFCRRSSTLASTSVVPFLCLFDSILLSSSHHLNSALTSDSYGSRSSCMECDFTNNIRIHQ
jgi:hypothetical protein